MLDPTSDYSIAQSGPVSPVESTHDALVPLHSITRTRSFIIVQKYMPVVMSVFLS
jgi:hypothetical protein